VKLRIALVIVGVIGIAVWASVRRPAHPKSTIRPSLSPSPFPSEKPEKKVNEYAYELFQADASTIFILPNYEKREDSTTLVESHQCRYAINGGFYDTNNKPLGYLVEAGSLLNPVHASQLLDSYFAINFHGAPSITFDVPATSSAAFQSGPMLVHNETPLTLTIRNDEHARRMIAGTLRDDRVVFITIFNPESVFDGPLLADTPDLLGKIQKQESLTLTNAVNLDGGSASVFYSPERTLKELTPVGALLCIKNVVQ
jgi:uncharacterized protein YigE (DUF2233 family)